jgi:hypothetical protein
MRRSCGFYFTEGQRCAAGAATFTWRELVQPSYNKLDDDAFTRVPGSEPKLTARQVVGEVPMRERAEPSKAVLSLGGLSVQELARRVVREFQ